MQRDNRQSRAPYPHEFAQALRARLFLPGASERENYRFQQYCLKALFHYYGRPSAVGTAGGGRAYRALPKKAQLQLLRQEGFKTIRNLTTSEHGGLASVVDDSLLYLQNSGLIEKFRGKIEATRARRGRGPQSASTAEDQEHAPPTDPAELAQYKEAVIRLLECFIFDEDYDDDTEENEDESLPAKKEA